MGYDDFLQFSKLFYFLTVNTDDDVAAFDAALFGSTIRSDLININAGDCA